jgi:hypothetical protein
MAVQVSGPGASWVQLTYTSADAIAGVKGGWGVKETLPPGADQTVVSILTEGVVARIEEVVETSQFASEADLATRVRRLACKEVDGVLVMWHAVAAGLDATGRPGNVYNHAAALTPDNPAVRAIDYWRSPDWLVPFGAANVTAARLGELRPGTVITRESTVAFLRAGDRVFNLEWILAAVSHACSTGTTVALVTDTADEAAAWIGAISFLTAPGLARRLSFVTFDRAARLGDSTLAGLRIVAVPRVDLPALETATGSVLVVDPAWSLDDPGPGAWCTPLGQTFAPDQSWQSGLIDLFALDDDERILRILAASDEITAEFSRVELERLPLHWSLSMAMLADPEVQVIDRARLTFECLRVAPAAALGVPGVQSMLDKVSADLTGASVRDQVGNGELGPLLQRVAAASVMREYLDGGWQQDRDAGLPPNLVGTALDDNLPAVAAAIKGAEGVMMGTPDQILSGARLVSLLLDHPGPGREPEALKVAVAAFGGQLGKPEMAHYVDEIAVLHPALSAGMLAVRRSAPAPAAAAARTEPVRANPPGVVSAIPPTPAPVAVEPAPEPESRLALLSADRGEALAELLADATIGTDRYFGLADAIRVERGLRAVPLNGIPDGAHGVMLQIAEDQWRSPANPPPVQAVFSAWLATFHAMTEADTSVIYSPPGGLVVAVSSWQEPHAAELTRVLVDPMTSPEQVAQIAVFAIRKSFLSSSTSVLASKGKDGRMMGWRAVKAAFNQLPDARHAAIWQYLEPLAIKAKADLGSYDVLGYVDELRRKSVGAEPQAAEKRAGRR